MRVLTFCSDVPVGVAPCSNEDLQRTLRESLDRYEVFKASMAMELARKDEAIARQEGEMEM